MTNHLQPAGRHAPEPRTGEGDLRGPPAVIDGEDAIEYEETFAGILELVKPADIFEQIWVREVVDLIWEAQRLRRFRVNLIRTATRQALQNRLRPIIYSDRQPGSDSKDYPNEQVLAAGWAAGERKATDRVEKLLGSVGMSVPAVAAQAMAGLMAEIERTDRMIAMLEQRRIGALREMEGRRARLAQALRRAADGIGRAGIGAEEGTGKTEPATEARQPA